MLEAILALVLLARPGFDPSRAREVADALRRAVVLVQHEERRAIDVALVVSIAYQESRFELGVCAEDAYGGSSRGLMGVRVPTSRCGDGKRPELLRAGSNAREGVGILAAWLRRSRHRPWEALRRYSGGSSKYADEVTGRANALREKARRGR